MGVCCRDLEVGEELFAFVVFAHGTRVTHDLSFVTFIEVIQHAHGEPSCDPASWMYVASLARFRALP